MVIWSRSHPKNVSLNICADPVIDGPKAAAGLQAMCCGTAPNCASFT